MGMLDRLLRKASSPRYYPFSQSSYRGGYPFRKAGRYDNFISNAAPYSAALGLNQYALPLPSRLSLYEDRRRWTPYEVKPPTSLTESYIRMVDRPMKRDWPQDPFDPYHPLRDPFTAPVRKSPKPFSPEWYKDPGERPEQWKVSEAMAEGRIAFENPLKMVICLKRKMRREVMHALGLSGIKGQKSPKFNKFSTVRC